MKCPKFVSDKSVLFRAIVCLVLIIILLQAITMTVLKNIKNTRSKRPKPVGFVADFDSGRNRNGYSRNSFSASVRVLVDGVINKASQNSVMDKSGSYLFVPNIVQMDRNRTLFQDNKDDVTICTQTDPSHIYNLVDLSERWTGPVSVAVFAVGVDCVNAVYAMIYLHMCFPSVAQHVSFHLAYPVTFPPKNFSLVSNKEFSCDIPFKDLKLFKILQNYARNDTEYPNNFLRNVAVSSAKSPYILVIDIDIVPSRNLYFDFVKFSKRKHISNVSNSTVYVIPSFESKGTSKLPQTKIELLKQWDGGLIRPFYLEVCFQCHNETDYEKWRRLSIAKFLDTGYVPEWREPWEPFYIARLPVPLYDEKFKQYGYNRISQMCELHVAGYQFAVLNNAFLVHKGFKRPDSFHSQRNEEEARNFQLFIKFKKGLKNIYPNSKKHC